MWNIFSVTIMITNVIHFILNFFGKRRRKKTNEADVFRTPLRPESRESNRDFINANERDKRVCSLPKCFPSRLPKTFPLTRNPSQISLLGSNANKDTPFRPQAVIRNRGSTTNLQSTGNDVFPRVIFPVTNTSEDLPTPDYEDFPANRSSTSPAFEFYSAAEDLSNGDLHLGNCWRQSSEPHAISGASTAIQKDTDVRGRRFNSASKYLQRTESYPPLGTPSQTSLLVSNKYTSFKAKGITRARDSSTDLRNLKNNALNFSFPDSDSINARRRTSLQDYRLIPAAEERVDMQLIESSGCCDGTPRYLRLRSNPHSIPGCTPYKQNCSRVPIRNLGGAISPKSVEFMNFPERHPGRHTIKQNSFGMSGFQEKGDITDTPYITSNDKWSWGSYRIDTIIKFERLFKSLSKKKTRATSNMIDASTHAKWMRLAGTGVDKDAFMFKSFAGGKVVLTLVDYKILLERISLAHNIDYWDILQKMVTFPEEGQLQHEEEEFSFN